MELSVREWMMIVGVLLIVAVLLDGYRRVRNERRNRIRVSLSKHVYQQHQYDGDEVEDEDARTVSFELPNGGARVIRPSSRRRRDDLKLDEPVPMLVDSVQLGQQSSSAEQPPAEIVEPIAAESCWQEPPAEPEPAQWREPEPIHEREPRRSRDERAHEMPESAVQESLWDNDDAVPEPPASSGAKKARAGRESIRHAEPSAAELNPAPQEVLVINVLSKDENGFRGPDLLQIMLACDLRFGRMNIFHRYEKANGRGQVQFSVANLVEPGTFSLDAIDSFSTPGVSFFLALPGPEAPIRAFDYMVETAQALVRNLNAELRDEAHSVITMQTLEHCRQRIRDFERRQLTLHV